MGIPICPKEYDVESEPQAILCLCIAFIYIISEIFYIWKFITVIKNDPRVINGISLCLLYGIIHVIYIFGMFYYLGGVVLCYGKYLYVIFGECLSCLERALIYLLMLRINKYLNMVIQGFKAVISYKVIVFLAISDVTISFIVNIISTYLDEGSYVFFMNLIADFFFVIIYICTVISILKAINLQPEHFNKKLWLIMMITIFVYIIMHLGYLLIFYTWSSKSILHIVIIGINNICTDLAPGIILVWFFLNSSNIKKNPGSLMKQYLNTEIEDD